ncbi:hiran domain protein [bacterium]|nr:hiran domain protein [bacterium]
MNQKDFINTLGLSASGLFIPKHLAERKPAKIYDNYVRGLKHYRFLDCKDQIKEGDELTLQPEPENQYDRYAISVHWQGNRMGFIAAYENVVLANMMRQGVYLSSFVSQIAPKLYPFNALAVEVFAELIIAKPPLLEYFANERADDSDDYYRKL